MRIFQDAGGRERFFTELPEATTGTWSLEGVIASNVRANSIALIGAGSAPAAGYKTGEPLSDGTVLVAITSDAVVLKNQRSYQKVSIR